MLINFAAAAAEVLAAIGASVAPIVRTPSNLSSGRPVKNYHRGAYRSYVRRTPTTPADFAALDRAQRERDRKGAKRAASHRAALAGRPAFS